MWSKIKKRRKAGVFLLLSMAFCLGVAQLSITALAYRKVNALAALMESDRDAIQADRKSLEALIEFEIAAAEKKYRDYWVVNSERCRIETAELKAAVTVYHRLEE